MRRRQVAVMLTVAVIAVAGCGGETQTAKRPETIAAEKVAQALDAGKLDGEPSTEVVKVLAAGSDFEPPVRIDQIPAAAWYCDMGTVHYARLMKGDGVCPRCSMLLTQKAR